MSNIEVDKVSGLVCHEASKIATDNTVPCSSFARVELGLV